MSIIIRLQNLPLSAKSADIRKFFGGLRIPDGGVHILGGAEGDAFIGFNSDEDARLAMRKDGGKIKDLRVKLYLSSRMEMQHEVEKITQAGISGSSSQEPFSQNRDLSEFSTHGSSERRRYSHSRSPHRYDKWNNDGHRKLNLHRQRSRSPIDHDSRHRSRSPNRRSKLFQRPHSPRKSPSPKARSASNHFQKRSDSPKVPSYTHSLQGLDAKDTGENFAYDYKHKEFPSNTSEIQAELERRITEAMEKNSAMMSSFQHPESSISGLDLPPGSGVPFSGQNIPSGTMQNDLHSSPLPNFFHNHYQQFSSPEFEHNRMRDQEGINPTIITHPEMLMASGDIGRQRMNDGFYVTISGLEPVWNFREVQMILKGIYAPQSNIRFETNNAGYRTGAAFVKLTNQDDFQNVINKATVFFNDHEITASECPEFLYREYFSDSTYQSEHNMQHNRDLCYVLKGLPFACTYEGIVNFFEGFEVADVVVFYGKDNKATGTGYVSFTNRKDFEGAIIQNGKKIGHRYIEMLPATEKEMAESKKLHPSAHSFKSYSKILSEKKLPPSRRPLCAVMTGLPYFTSVKHLLSFFADAGLKPYAMHITKNKVNGKYKCDGRGFVEFINFRDFVQALKLHGNSFKDSVICVKQILYDEMLKILDTQKARHYFEPQEVVTHPLDIPEKVPYLWEPPDETESEDDKVNISNSFLEDQYLYSKNKRDMKRNYRPAVVPNSRGRMMNANRFPARPSMVPNAMDGIMNINPFPARPLMPPNAMMNIGPFPARPVMAPNPMDGMINTNPFPAGPLMAPNAMDGMMNTNPFPAMSLIPPNAMDDGMMNTNPFPARPLMVPNSVDEMRDANSFPANKKFQRKKNFSPRVQQLIHIKTETESEINAKNVSREPIKFNVNKQLINTKTAKTFDSTKSAEEKFKLSKLSPDKETNETNLKKNFKGPSSKTKDAGFKHTSPQRNVTKANIHKGRGKTRYNVLEYKYSSAKSGSRDSFSKSRNEKETVRSNERKSDFRRSPPRLDIRHSETDRRFEDRSQECIVQMSNVSLSVGNHDFLQFLQGFAFYEDSIIRKYANEEPTEDVRVAFVNRLEADLAIRSLAGRRLKGLKVNMFIA